MADLPEIVGFFSYSRDDDNDSNGALSALRNRIQRELRGRLGRTKATFRLWQDTAAIPQGALWEEEIKAAVAQSAFFIPIITPTTIRSHHCKKEFALFLAREAQLGRRDLIFPLMYIRVPELENEAIWRKDEVLNVIGTRQYLDWKERRYLDVNSPEVAAQIGRFCDNIYDALSGTPGDNRSERTEQPTAPVPIRQDFAGRAIAAASPAHGDPPRAIPPTAPAATSKISLLLGLGGLLLGLAIVGVVLWQQKAAQVVPPVATPSPLPAPSTAPVATAPAPTPSVAAAPTPADPVMPPPAAAPALPSRFPEAVIRKGAAVGGKGGNAFDDSNENPQRLQISGIAVTVTLNPGSRNQKVIGRVQTQWANWIGPVHGGGPDDVPTSPIQFTPDETITKVDVNAMFYTFPGLPAQPNWVSGLRIFTNKNVYWFGDMSFGPTTTCVVAPGERFIGFFGRAGSYVDQLGCLFAKPK